MRHGGAVRASLRAVYGVNLNDVLTGRMLPDEAWDLLVHLPRVSALTAVLAADEEFASAEPPPPSPSLAEFGPEVEALAAVHDRLAELCELVASFGGRPPRMPRYPRPKLASERARRKAAAAEWAALNNMLTGGR